VNIQPLLDTLGIQEDAARALADDLRTQITELQGRLREAEIHLEHLAITRKTVTALSERLPAHPVRFFMSQGITPRFTTWCPEPRPRSTRPIRRVRHWSTTFGFWRYTEPRWRSTG
jgi:hypothetical protein